MAIHESIETILLKRNRKAWRKDFGPKKFDSMLSESETEDKQRALRSGSYKPGDEAPKVSTTKSTAGQKNTDNPFYTGDRNSGIMGQSGNSDPYAIQENRQAQYTNPYDIPDGYNPNDYIYKSETQKANSDPYAIQWTEEQKKQKQLQDAMTQRDNLENSFVGMPTTEVVVKLGEHDDVISQLSQQLGVGDRTSTQNVAAPMSAPDTPALGQSFTADVVDQSQDIALLSTNSTDDNSGVSDSDNGSGGLTSFGDYYVDPDDYASDEAYAREMWKIFNEFKDAESADAFLIANGHKAGMEGISALQEYTEDVLGAFGFDALNNVLGKEGETPGAENGQPENVEPEETQPRASTPVSSDEPEYELYGSTKANDADGGYINLYDDIPTMDDIEAERAAQAENAPVGQGFMDDVVDQTAQNAAEAPDYHINPVGMKDEDYAQELLKQLYLHSKDGSMDEFLTQNGYATGDEGKLALIQEVQDRIGAENVPVLWESLDEMYGGEPLQHVISAAPDETEPPTARPGWEGPKGEKLYLEGLNSGRWQEIFGDFNSDDTIAYLRNINENTPVAGGISGIIDLFEDDELRMITRTFKITTEEINKERVAQTESNIKGVAGLAGFIMDIASFYASSKQNTDSAGVTNDIFMDFGIDNITGQVDTESICHAIADFLTKKVSGNETYTREETFVYCFTTDGYGGYYYKKMEFTFDYTPYAWHYANVNRKEYYNNY